MGERLINVFATVSGAPDGAPEGNWHVQRYTRHDDAPAFGTYYSLEDWYPPMAYDPATASDFRVRRDGYIDTWFYQFTPDGQVIEFADASYSPTYPTPESVGGQAPFYEYYFRYYPGNEIKWGGIYKPATMVESKPFRWDKDASQVRVWDDLQATLGDAVALGTMGWPDAQSYGYNRLCAESLSPSYATPFGLLQDVFQVSLYQSVCVDEACDPSSPGSAKEWSVVYRFAPGRGIVRMEFRTAQQALLHTEVLAASCIRTDDGLACP